MSKCRLFSTFEKKNDELFQGPVCHSVSPSGRSRQGMWQYSDCINPNLLWLGAWCFSRPDYSEQAGIERV
jgi:hypothetical protein